MGFNLCPGRELFKFAFVFHCPVPGELGLGHGMGLGRGVPRADRGGGFHATRKLGGDTQADVCLPHFREAHGAALPAFGEGFSFLQFPDFCKGFPQVAVVFECVEAEVEVGVEGEHGFVK